MPKLITNPESVSSSRINFKIEFARVKDLQARIADKEYGLKNSCTTLSQIHKKRLAIIDPCPKVESGGKLDSLKDFYKKYFIESCKHLVVLIKNDHQCEELNQFTSYYNDYTNKLIKKNNEQSWDELYNFTNLLKHTICHAKTVTYLGALAKHLDSQLDEHYVEKENKERIAHAKNIIARKSAAILVYHKQSPSIETYDDLHYVQSQIMQSLSTKNIPINIR